MKKILVAATLMVSGLAWGNPVDLTNSQLICNSAVQEVRAALLTDVVAADGQVGFLYVEDVNGDGAFTEDEYSVFNGTYATSSNNEFLNQFASQLSGATVFGTVQEITADLGDYTASFSYGFGMDAYDDVEFAVLSLTEVASGNVVFALPLVCQEYVPQQQ